VVPPVDVAQRDLGQDAVSDQKIDDLENLSKRLGRRFLTQRLGLERHYQGIGFNRRIGFPRRKKWYLWRFLMRGALKLTGLYWFGRRQASLVQVRRNFVRLRTLPAAFDGFTILHVSDLHVESSEGALRTLVPLLSTLTYDLCVLTGDYRDGKFGAYDIVLARMTQVLRALKGPVYGALGNHDTIRMVTDLERLGMRMLVNETTTIQRGDQTINLAGIDDAHYFRTDNIEKAAAVIPPGKCSILLSHTPEVYRQAAHAGFDLMLSGHTHGGQICLPRGIPVVRGGVMPRRIASGPWSYREMAGYTSRGVGTSIVPVRLNCPPEITLHYLSAK
jgi:predicted MPP superfamily phosphohydrolase